MFIPFKTPILKSNCRKRLTLFLLVLFSLTFYSYTLFTTVILKENDKDTCTTPDNMIGLVKTMALIDSILTFILPFKIVLIINLAIIIKMLKFKREKKPKMLLSQKKNSSRYKNSIAGNNNNQSEIQDSQIKDMIEKTQREDLLSSNKECKFCKNIEKNSSFTEHLVNIELFNRNKVYWKMTRMLLAISISFLILNFPIFFSKLLYFIKYLKSREFEKKITNKTTLETTRPTTTLLHVLDNVQENMNATIIEELIERLSCYIYYLSYSINFVLYACSSLRKRKNIY